MKVAVNNIDGISYADFKGQVAAYLLDTYQTFYDSPKKWNEICEQVIHAIQGKK